MIIEKFYQANLTETYVHWLIPQPCRGARDLQNPDINIHSPTGALG